MSDERGRDGRPGGDGEGALLTPIPAGGDVCVWNRYLERWTGGFAVAEVLDGGYRLRRLSDGQVFEDVFRFDEVRPERRQVQQPGYVGTPLDRRTRAEDDQPGTVPGREEPFLR